MTCFWMSGVQLGVEVDALGVLRGQHHGVDADGAVVVVVLDGDLGLAVGTQVVERAVLAHLGELLREPVGQRDRQRHQLGGVVAGVAEHQALVAGALLVHGVDRAGAALVSGVHALGDVAGLAADRDHHAAGVAVEALLGGVVADREDPVADLLLDVDVAGRGDLARHDHEAGGQQRLDRDPAVRVLLEHGVEHRVTDLVGDLVRVPLGHGLRGEQASSHRLLPCTWSTGSVGFRENVIPSVSARGQRSQDGSLLEWYVEQRGDLVPDDVGQGLLRAARDGDRLAARGEHHRLVVGAAEHGAPADVVDHQQVAALAGQLGPGVVEDGAVVVAGLGRETDHDLGVPAGVAVADQPGQDVGRLGQLDRRRRAVAGLLDLRAGLGDRTEVGGRRGHHDRVGAGRRGGHLRRCSSSVVSTWTTLTPAGSGEDHVGGDQRDLGAAGGGGAGQREALATGGAVAEEPHRVEVLAGAAGRHHDPAPGQVARCSPYDGRAGRRTKAKISAGSGSRPLPESAPVSRPSAGSTTCAPALAERGHVGLRRGVLPHLGVHRGREHDRAARGQQRVGEQVVGEAVRGLRQQVGGRRSDHDQVGALPDPDVRAPRARRSTRRWRPACRTGPPRSGRRRTASADAVGTTVTSWPDSVSRRSSSQALYAAIPPLTPSTTWGRDRDVVAPWVTRRPTPRPRPPRPRGRTPRR